MSNNHVHGHTTHGLNTLKKAVKVLGGRLVDRRTTLGKLLDEWRAQLVLDLGGVEAVSTQQLAVVNLAVKTKLILDSIDAWLLKQPSLINHRKRTLYPVVGQRQQLADSLARYMGQLGLERRAKPLQSLQDYVATRYASSPSNGKDNEEPDGQGPA